MKLTTAHKYKIPIEGCRSENYFGIHLFLDHMFFNKTRSGFAHPQRPDPRIKAFRMKEQAQIRADLIECGDSLGFTLEQIESEWRFLVKQATAKATESWELDCGKKRETPVPYNKQAIKLLENAFRVGRAWLNHEVSLRSDTTETWVAIPAFQLKLADCKPVKIKRNVPLKMRYEIMKRDAGKFNGIQTCLICLSTNGPWHVDHIISLAKGGNNDPSNLQTLCDLCNLGKGAI